MFSVLKASPPMSGGFMDQGPRQMKVEEEESLPSQNLWVGNLPADVTETMLMETFAKFGEIDNITAYPQRNYAFVYFKHIEHAIAAKEGLQGVSLGVSNLKIEFSRAVSIKNPNLLTNYSEHCFVTRFLLLFSCIFACRESIFIMNY